MLRRFCSRDASKAVGLLHVAAALLIGGFVAVGAVWLLKKAEASPQVQRSVAFACLAIPLVLLTCIRCVGRDDALATVATGVALCAIVVAGLTYVGAIDKDPESGCINTHGPIEATVAGDPTVIHEEASAASPPQGMLRRGCEIHATAWCVGAVHEDAIDGNAVLDTRWLVLPSDRGLVPYGRTVGAPLPEDRRDDNCRGAVERPREVRFDRALADPEGGFLAFYARADRAAFIGFAVRRGEDLWQRIGWEYEPADDIPVVLRMPDPQPVEGDEISAVACVGYQQPATNEGTAVVHSRTLTRGPALTTARPPAKQPTAATAPAAACDAAVPIPTPLYEPGSVRPESGP